jgi:hypothetical protein
MYNFELYNHPLPSRTSLSVALNTLMTHYCRTLPKVSSCIHIEDVRSPPDDERIQGKRSVKPLPPSNLDGPLRIYSTHHFQHHSHNMSSSKDASLYGFQRPKRLKGDKEISSNTTGSFTSQLSSLINKPKTSNTNEVGARPRASRTKAKKEDIFATHNRNSAARAQRDLDKAASPAFAQEHTTNGEGLDGAIWERSKRKMEEKARLYAAMKRGDVEDEGERFAVDFDRKWAEKYGDGQSGDEDLSDEEEDDDDDGGMVEYVDEFGRTRQGTRADAARVARQERGLADMNGDRFTARPSAPSTVIYGDTIQHQAFNPDMPIAMQMEELAKKRDRSLTPPPDLHFDASREVRTKGTGFFQFSDNAEERKKQMAELERERLETERVRREREKRDAKEQTKEEASQIERGQSAQSAQTAQDAQDKRGYKRKADDFFDELAAKMAGKTPPPGSNTTKEPEDAMDAMQRIEAALAREAE